MFQIQSRSINSSISKLVPTIQLQKQSSYCKATSHLDSQEITRILWNLRMFSVAFRCPLDPVLSQLNLTILPSRALRWNENWYWHHVVHYYTQWWHTLKPQQMPNNTHRATDTRKLRNTVLSIITQIWVAFLIFSRYCISIWNLRCSQQQTSTMLSFMTKYCESAVTTFGSSLHPTLLP